MTNTTDDKTDFTKWIETAFHRDHPHAILPGFAVRIESISHLHILTADQAMELSRRLAELAGTGEEGEVARLRRLCESHHIDPDRCGNFPKGEQCGRQHGHEGKCCWNRGD